MKRTLATLAFAAAVAAVPFRAAAQDDVADPIQVTLEVPAEVKVGDPIPLKVTVKNTGAADVTLREAKFDANSIDFMVKFGDGKWSRYTKYPRDPRMQSTTLSGVDLKPGETLMLDNEVIALKAGDWGFQAVCRRGTQGASKSAEHTVKVVAKDGAEQMLWEMKTTAGTMTFEFWPKVAPATSLHISNLARSGFYDGTIFHRTIKGFMIQGGDPDGTGGGGPGFSQQAEYNDRKHIAGVLSMASTAAPNSAGSQFFIMHGANAGLDGKYTGFGEIVSGKDVLDKIATAPVGQNSMGEMSKPTNPVKIESSKLMLAPAGSGQ